MTSVERVDAVLDHRRPDRFPVALHNYLQVARYAGVDDLGVWLMDGEAMAEAHIKMRREVGHDLIQFENSTCAMAAALGCEVAFDKILPPHVAVPVLRSYDMLEDMDPPDPFESRSLRALVKAAEVLETSIGKEAYIQARADQGPIALAVSIMDPQQFLLDCMDPERRKDVRALLAFCTKCIIRLCEAYASLGIRATCIGGMGTSLISPHIWETLEQHYQREYVHACHKLGLRPFIHTCGKEDKFLGGIVATGCDALELDHLSTAELVAGAIRGKSTVLGMIDPVGIMADGTPKDVEEAARCIFDVFRKDASLIIGPGCALPPHAPVENCVALVEAAERYGRLP